MSDYGPRHRERVKKETSYAVRQITGYDALRRSSYSYETSAAYKALDKLESIDDVVLRNYRARVKAGEIMPVNPLTVVQSETTRFPTEIDERFQRGETWQQSRGFIYVMKYAQGTGLQLYEDQINEDVLALATTEAYANVSSAKTLLLATIAEYGSTRGMLINAFNSLKKLRKPIAQLSTTLRRLEEYAGNPGTLISDATNLWMEIRMGWRPFFGECQNTYEAINACTRPKYQTFRGQASICKSKASEPITGTLYNTYVGKSQNIETCSVSARTTIFCGQRVHGLPDTFGLTKIPETLWEITPLSWAVDYVFNFGDVIAAATPDFLWVPLTVAGTYVRKHEVKSQYLSGSRPDGSVYNPRGFYTGGISGGFVKSTVMTKVRRSDPPKAGLSISAKLNWQKLTDLAIVAKQQWRPAVKNLTKLAARCKIPKLRRRLTNA